MGITGPYKVIDLSWITNLIAEFITLFMSIFHIPRDLRTIIIG
jgi:hypothetical protein